MRSLILVFVATAVLWASGFERACKAQSYERPDSFFEHNYLTKDRDIEAEESGSASGSYRAPPGEDSFRKAGDSWEAPKGNDSPTAQEGQTVAGSNRVRDYRDGTGAFARSSSSSVGNYGAGVRAVPLGGGAVLVIPDPHANGEESNW